MSGLFSPDTLERVRAASDIVEVISGYVPLKKKAGASFIALCPFHSEKSPSFNVNPQRQIFHCFGCHKGGDVFKFVQEYEHLTFPEAVRRLAERARIPLEMDQNPARAEARQIKDQLLLLHEQVTQRWQAALEKDAPAQIARDYLARRQVPADALKLFRLGYASEAWDDTVNWARAKGHDLALLERAGLVLRKEGSDHFYDRFRGRLIFPICDEQGRVIGFSGRILAGDEKTAKYVNSPETPLFTKGKVIFGLDKSKRALLEAHSAIICEGQLDLIACFMAGLQNVVAPQGTALTADHVRILKRYVEEVVLCFDSDNAGQNAAIRSLDILLASGLAIRVATVPPPHDPDSFIKEFGGQAFRDLLGRATDFFDYYLTRLCATQDLTRDRGRLAVVRLMAEALAKTGNQVLFDQYSRKTALRLGVSPESVRSEFGKPEAPAVAADEEPFPTEAEAPAGPDLGERPPNHEFWLLKLLVQQEDRHEWFRAHLRLDWLSHPGVRSLVLRQWAAQEAGRWTGVAAWLSELEEEPWAFLVTEAAADERPVTDPDKQVQDLLLRLRNDHLDLQLGACTRQMGQPELSEEERFTLLRRQQLLRQEKRQPLQPVEG